MATFVERERKLQETPRARELTETERAKVDRIRGTLAEERRAYWAEDDEDA